MIAASVRQIYQIIFRLYPAEFRAAVGQSLLADFDEGLGKENAGRVGFGIRQTLDLARNLSSEWRTPSGPRRPGRDRGRTSRLRAMREDIRSAGRSLHRDPAFTLVAVVVMGLGMAGLIAVYGIVEAVLLEPLPYPDANRLVSLTESYRIEQRKSVAYPNYLDWRARNRTLEELGARAWNSINLTGLGPARNIDAMGITPNLLGMLGVGTLQGRIFNETEAADRARVILLSEGFWRDTMGARPDVVGETLLLDGEPFIVVGVLEDQAEFPLAEAALWMPLRTSLSSVDMSSRSSHPGIEAIGRMTKGTNAHQARLDFERIATELASDYPETNAEAGVVVRPLRERVVANSTTTLWLLFGAVTIVMLAISANVAGLMLTRATRRDGELAVRAALGAARSRLATQLTAEALLLAISAGFLGLTLAAMVLRLVRGSSGLGLARLNVVQMDSSVAAAAIAIATLCGLVVAGTTLTRLTHIRAAATLRDAAERSVVGSKHRLRRLLVTTQVALAVVLLAGAGLMTRSLTNLAQAGVGIAPGNVLTAYIGPPQTSYPENADRVELYAALASAARALPGVVGVSGGDPLPLSGRNNQTTLSGDGFPQIDEMGHRVEVTRIMPDYFATMGIDLLEGRDVRLDDTIDSPVVLIDSTLAETLFPDGRALGQRLRIRGPAADRPWHTIVGVVGHVKNYGIRNESRGQLYVPFTTSAWGMTLLVETERGGTDAEVIDALRTTLFDIDPELPLTRVSTVNSYLHDSIATETILTQTLSGFAAVALIVSIIGLYGMVAYSVALRTREIGIRMALGARAARVLSTVVLEGALLGTVGAAGGVVVSLLAGRWIASALYDITPADPGTLGAAATGMIVVAVLAAFVPALRAIRVQPTQALRG
ncbi:MAG: FtsX-like permease family protein [Acidobacteria bacterium]|nr:FtsX-like permease family protein [Acidobacteriota bacterium]